MYTSLSANILNDANRLTETETVAMMNTPQMKLTRTIRKQPSSNLVNRHPEKYCAKC